MRRHPAILGVDAQDDLLGKLPRHLSQPAGSCSALVPMTTRLIPQERTSAISRSERKPPPSWHGTPLASTMARMRGAVHRLAFPGAVEIDDVQDIGPVLHPAARHRGGIGVKDGLLLIIALPQPDTLAAAQVDRGKNLHESRLQMRRGQETRRATAPAPLALARLRPAPTPLALGVGLLTAPQHRKVQNKRDACSTAYYDRAPNL